MKIIKKHGKRYLVKGCLFCQKEFKVSSEDISIEMYNGIVTWGKCLCTNCGEENYVKPIYVFALNE